jgi:formylglycine-generating enzyme required for sulfatase activity
LEQRCQEGACVDPCAQVVCDAPEQPYCEGNTRVVPVSNTCQWETGQCLVQEERQDCPDRCHRGHCMPGNTVVILAGEIKHAWGDSGPARATNTISRPFLMHQAEVTRQEYRLLINQDPSVTRTSDLIPVNNVTWLEAVLFSIELNNIQRLDVCYTRSGQALYEPISDCPGWRLPTLLEFQHAQRAGATTIFSCGEEAQCLEGTAHCGPDTGYAQVRQLLPNAWGLYDITGNVAEWTHDWYGEVPTQDTVDWDGPRGGQRRYLAGGYAGDSASFCAVFARRLLSPEDTGPEAGFRLVRTLHPAP